MENHADEKVARSLHSGLTYHLQFSSRSELEPRAILPSLAGTRDMDTITKCHIQLTYCGTIILRTILLWNCYLANNLTVELLSYAQSYCGTVILPTILLWNYYLTHNLTVIIMCVVIVINYPFNLEAVECERILFC